MATAELLLGLLHFLLRDCPPHSNQQPSPQPFFQEGWFPSGPLDWPLLPSEAMLTAWLPVTPSKVEAPEKNCRGVRGDLWSILYRFRLGPRKRVKHTQTPVIMFPGKQGAFGWASCSQKASC